MALAAFWSIHRPHSYELASPWRPMYELKSYLEPSGSGFVTRRRQQLRPSRPLSTDREIIWGFPKPSLGVPITRIVVSWSLTWGHATLNCAC